MDVSIAPNASHHIAHAAPAIKTILIGVTYMTAIISSAVAVGIGFGLGWYIKGRGMAGVQIDLGNIKTDIANLKAKLSAPIAA